MIRLSRLLTAAMLLIVAIAGCGDDATGSSDKPAGAGQVAGVDLDPGPDTDDGATDPLDEPTQPDGPDPTDPSPAPEPPPTPEGLTPDGSIVARLQAPECPFLAGQPNIIPDWEFFDADDQAMLSPLVRFASGMETNDYGCAWDTFGDNYQGRAGGEAAWAQEQSTTDIASYEILAITRQDSDTAIVDTVWQSLQDPEYARGGTGETCTTWPLQYQLTRVDGIWLFDRLLGGGADATAC